MKAHKNWSYHPFRLPVLFDHGDIYICRIEPTDHSILFDFLDDGDGEYTVYYRERGKGDFIIAGKTREKSYTIEGLTAYAEYEFYVACGDRKSRVRIAECANSVGKTVNYLHPEDTVYSFSGKYLCSPSLVRHPDGFLLASMDVFGQEMPQNLTLIFRSDDNGESWHYVSELYPCFWGKMFIHRGALYMLSCSTEHGDILIGRSDDGGYTFTEPSVLLRGTNGKMGNIGPDKSPQPVVEFNGRLYNTLDYGSWQYNGHASIVFSAPVDADLLDPDSWSFSEPCLYDPTWKGVPAGETCGCLEGSLVKKDGKLYNIMRYDMRAMDPSWGKALVYEVNTSDPEAPQTFLRAMNFPGNHSKFVIQKNELTGKYYSVINRITSNETCNHRNLLSLVESEDLEEWRVVCDIVDKRDCDPQKNGFQYTDFIMEGKKLYMLIRVGMNRCGTYHNTNYSVFKVIDLK